MKNSIIVLTLIFAFGLSGCKKYEEGPMLSLRTKKARVCNKWVLEESRLDGDIVTFASFINYYEFNKDGEYIINYNDPDGVSQEVVGSWEFYDSKKSIIRSYPDIPYGSNPYSGVTDTVRILMLKEKELWVSKDLNTGVLEERYLPE